MIQVPDLPPHLSLPALQFPVSMCPRTQMLTDANEVSGTAVFKYRKEKVHQIFTISTSNLEAPNVILQETDRGQGKSTQGRTTEPSKEIKKMRDIAKWTKWLAWGSTGCNTEHCIVNPC